MNQILKILIVICLLAFGALTIVPWLMNPSNQSLWRGVAALVIVGFVAFEFTKSDSEKYYDNYDKTFPKENDSFMNIGVDSLQNSPDKNSHEDNKPSNQKE